MGLITTSSALLNELDYNNLASSEQAEVQALIEVASELVEAYCNRSFAAEDRTEVYDGTGDELLIVNNPPIISLTSITFTSAADGTTEVIAASEFDYVSGHGEIRWLPYSTSGSKYKDYFQAGFRNISIAYRGGYESNELPYPIQKAVADLVKIMFDPSMNKMALEKEKLGEYFYQLNAEKIAPLLSDHNKMLRLYKLYR